jgi:hypothetical protein
MAKVSSTAVRVDQTNDAQDPSRRGAIRIDLEVTPAASEKIGALHLEVAITADGTQEALVSNGDPLAGSYKNITAALPANWQFAGVVGVKDPNDRGKFWYATWHKAGGADLPAGVAQKFSLLYSGLQRVALGSRKTLILSDGADLDPNTGAVDSAPAHAPTGK